MNNRKQESVSDYPGAFFIRLQINKIVFKHRSIDKGTFRHQLSFVKYTLFFYKNQQLSAQAGLFLILWRFQPRLIVLKLFLFPDTFKQ